MRVADILKIKGSPVILASPSETFPAVAMKSHVGRVEVGHDGASIGGHISERDVFVSVAVSGRDFLSVLVAT